MTERTGEGRNSLAAVLVQVRILLKEAGIETWSWESFLLLEWKLGITRSDYYMDPGRFLSEEEEESLMEAARRRAERQPLQYMMGECEFMGFPFLVDERVLIPRQDTELLVETALAQIGKKLAGRSTEDGPVRVLDLCTGSGAIGISVKLLCPGADVTISDLSPDAMAAAGENWERLKGKADGMTGCSDDFEESFHMVVSDLFEGLEGNYDFILSNPPYIPSGEIDGLMPEVRDHEPRLALDGEDDGLAFYRKISSQACRFLNAGGSLFLEIGAGQGETVAGMLKDQGFKQVEIKKDLAGLDRLVWGMRADH